MPDTGLVIVTVGGVSSMSSGLSQPKSSRAITNTIAKVFKILADILLPFEYQFLDLYSTIFDGLLLTVVYAHVESMEDSTIESTPWSNSVNIG